ncbi:LysR family transcriptional regulator [Paraburkholderia sp. DHOC27]|uniref:LysR family transcriptional regulator n=1 Tax=Paraburkholderia sp. DHOC27 TaxID=2303330 RepID=UPI000E3CE64A|nr:LysR family transcriptional regulator [Paraburkholderia sp. DHOC27]RFU49125.1 LysR family transcriptional regulator [Paraburkholderia sp. DHOC27]
MDQLASMRAFVTVARTQSFTKAAEILNVSRGALSRAISDLEAHTRARLLNRTTRHVSLVEAARDYYNACARIIDELEQAERRLTDDKMSECGYVRVVVHPLAVVAGMSTMLQAFAATAPCIKVHATVQDGPLNLVDSGYDLAIYPPDRITNSTIVSRPLFHSRFVLVASPKYLERNPSVSSICDLSAHRIVDGREQTLKKGADISLETSLCPDFSLQGSHFTVPAEIAREIALAGGGIALVPEVAVRRDIAQGDLREIRPGESASLGGVDLAVQYRQLSSTPRRTKTFIDACLGYFRALDREREASTVSE